MELTHVLVLVDHLDEAADRFGRLLGREPAPYLPPPLIGCGATIAFGRGPALVLLTQAPVPTAGPRSSDTAQAPGPVGVGFAAGDQQPLRWLDPLVMAGDACFVWPGGGVPPPASPVTHAAVISAIHHVVVDVPDAAATSLIWRERLGLRCAEQITSEAMGAVVLVHPAGAATVEAVGAIRPDGPVAERIARAGFGLSQVAFTVTDIDAAVARARAAGAVVSDPAPGVLPGTVVARIAPESAGGVSAQYILP